MEKCEEPGKGILKLFLKGAFILGLILLIFIPLEYIYDRVVVKDISEKRYWIYNQHDTFDFAVLGSSRAQNCVDIATLESSGKKKGINLGVSGVRCNECYIILKKFLEKNTIKQLFMEVNVHAFDHRSTSATFYPYYYIPYMADKEIAEAVEKNVSKKEWLCWKYIPFTPYIEYSTLVGPQNIWNVFRHKIGEFDENGTVLLAPAPFQSTHKMVNYKIEKAEVADLLKIIKLARKYKLEIAMFTSPDLEYNFPNRSRIEKFIEKIAIDNGITYYSFQHLKIKSHKEYFADQTHLNGVGAKLFSSSLADSVFRK